MEDVNATVKISCGLFEESRPGVQIFVALFDAFVRLCGVKAAHLKDLRNAMIGQILELGAETFHEWFKVPTMCTRNLK